MMLHYIFKHADVVHGQGVTGGIMLWREGLL